MYSFKLYTGMLILQSYFVIMKIGVYVQTVYEVTNQFHDSELHLIKYKIWKMVQNIMIQNVIHSDLGLPNCADFLMHAHGTKDILQNRTVTSA